MTGKCRWLIGLPSSSLTTAAGSDSDTVSVTGTRPCTAGASTSGFVDSYVLAGIRGRRKLERERFVRFFAKGSDSLARGESVWRGGVAPGLEGGSGREDGLRSFEPRDMKRRSFEGLRSRVGSAWCSRAVPRVGLLSLARSRFIVAAKLGALASEKAMA